MGCLATSQLQDVFGRSSSSTRMSPSFVRYWKGYAPDGVRLRDLDDLVAQTVPGRLASNTTDEDYLAALVSLNLKSLSKQYRIQREWPSCFLCRRCRDRSIAA